jgi:hypothetical protein
VNDGAIGGLKRNGIVFQAANISTPGSMSFPYNIQPWAWNYLHKHPDLLD